MKDYALAREAAQKAADADGMDRGLERMPGYGPNGGRGPSEKSEPGPLSFQPFEPKDRSS